MKLTHIIEKPIVTEKTLKGKDLGIYTFKVKLSASKGLVADELKRVFGVDATNIKTVIMPGKHKRVLRSKRYAKASNWKKAIVKIKDGQKIDLVAKK